MQFTQFPDEYPDSRPPSEGPSFDWHTEGLALFVLTLMAVLFLLLRF